jgi:excinuclease ABC subunit B
LRGGAEELGGLIATVTAQMMQASQELKFELAAKLRDEVVELKRELRQLVDATN